MLTPMFMLHMNAFALHLHGTVPYRTVLYCTVLYGTVLYCTLRYCTSLHPSLDYHLALCSVPTMTDLSLYDIPENCEIQINDKAGDDPV